MPVKRALLVAATGGHLDQLARIAAYLEEEGIEVEIATSDHPQVGPLLGPRTVHLVPRVPPRGLLQAFQVVKPAWDLLKTGRYTHVVSTGSGVAVPFFLVATIRGIPRTYVESAARTRGPSLTGRLVSLIPGTRLVTQHRSWADRRWRHRGSVFDVYSAEPKPARHPRSMVVTLGTMTGYPFPRALHAAQRLQRHFSIPEESVFWQVGESARDDANHHEFVAVDKLQEAMRDADLVVTHAGVGSCLQALDAGHVPVVLPRRVELGEHIDDHQEMIAELLADKGLAVVSDPDDLAPSDVAKALSRGVRKKGRRRQRA